MMNQNVAVRRKPRWLKVLIGLSLLIAAYWVLGIYFEGFMSMKCADEEWFFLRLVCGILSTYEGCTTCFRSLPTDEEMIAHFYKHRADFERLIQIYREDASMPNESGIIGYSERTPEMKAIWSRAKVNCMTNDHTIWMPPDPYSEEARLQIMVRGLNRKLPEGRLEARKFSGVELRYAHAPISLGVRKGYYYTPFAPHIQNRLLKTPCRTERVFPTLNMDPSKLSPLDCLYRQFEPHWFIRMWRGK